MLFAFVPFGRKILIREIIFQVVCFLVVYGMTAFGSKTQIFSSPFSIVIIIPAALFVLIEAILYGQLSAVFFSFMLSLGVFNATFFGSFNITPSCVVPFLFTLASCVSASMIVRKIERRIDMVVVSIILALIDTMMIVILSVIFNEVFNRLPVVLIGVAFNGFISGILALGFLTPVEFMLNTASVFRLMDLSDLNNPLMKKMLISASGTYNHSLMVAQLAESACREIGANALVARVGAYYHDIGKLDKSEYFVENHVAGETYDLTPSLYVSVIRSHIRKGVEKAHQLHLPRQIIEIIEQHHGNSVISYFYEKAKEENPDVNPEDYSYYGNPPVSKEAAVVMIADTVEAACRSLENPTEERLEKFIQTLINAKLENKQLDCCELTFRDITKVKEVFVPILVGYHHNRIKYPNQKDPEETAEQNDADKGGGIDLVHKHRLEQIQLSHRHIAQTEIALLQHKPGRSVTGEHAQSVLVNDDVDEEQHQCRGQHIKSSTANGLISLQIDRGKCQQQRENCACYSRDTQRHPHQHLALVLYEKACLLEGVDHQNAYESAQDHNTFQRQVDDTAAFSEDACQRNDQQRNGIGQCVLQ